LIEDLGEEEAKKYVYQSLTNDEISKLFDIINPTI